MIGRRLIAVSVGLACLAASVAAIRQDAAHGTD